MSKSVEQLIGRLVGEVELQKLEKLQPWGDVLEDFDMVQQQSDYCPLE